MTAHDMEQQSGDVFPRPDPTRLTSAALDKATQALREILETRITGIEAQIVLLQQDIRNRPAEIERAIVHLKELHEEKFSGVQIQFKERDERTTASKTASDTAVAAALQAQKEAAGESAKSFTLSIDKSERATLEQITQQRQQIQTSTANLDGKIDDLKERVTRIEGAAVGIVAAKTETVQTHTGLAADRGTIIALIGVTIAVFALAERFVR